ncbi:hypothetical protein DERP_007343 [Dermatophagoides pteronyssinus]|uniref:Uncharacterized protein n=1 Tax=Dermatophagoides pteronyssinus TaxID=6956 RepID=A0ABQ8J478_DERPT|nr:hypothetical protein DERP_007343 [Dermatophagoides pteronyssinus]
MFYIHITKMMRNIFSLMDSSTKLGKKNNFFRIEMIQISSSSSDMAKYRQFIGGDVCVQCVQMFQCRNTKYSFEK